MSISSEPGADRGPRAGSPRGVVVATGFWIQLVKESQDRMVTEQDGTDFAELLDSLQETPNTVATLTDGLSRTELCLKDSEDQFSALENLCHLRDLELQGYTPRIRRMLAEDNPALADFDGARVAAEGNYNSQQPGLALQEFQLARLENVQKLRSLSEEQLGREGTLEGVGRLTLRRLAEMMREHDEGHLDDLRVLRQRLERQRGLSEPGAVATGPMLK